MMEELSLSAVHGEGKEHGGEMVRLIFFTFCEDDREYQLQRSFLEQWADDRFVSPHPVLSLVTQKPLMEELVVEVYLLPAIAGEEVTVEEQMISSIRYLRVTSGHYREIIAGGPYADDLALPVRGQSEQVFGRAEEILKAEQMSFGDTVRQQSHLGHIMGIVCSNQCYQDFNDTRPQFYVSSEWASGYPAAIGIGTQRGEILVDFNAVRGGVEIIPLNSDWQRAAHAYSDEVLIDHRTDAERGTPKFEGGKSLSDRQQGMTYTSGTTAVHDEEGTMTDDVFVQTEITPGNIQYLIGLEEGREKLPEHSSKLELLRVYLKHEENAKIVREDTNKLCPDVPIAYLCADVCREELPVEIESIVYL